MEGVIPHDLFQCFELADGYCQVADGSATTRWYLADVTAKWLMELPLQGGGWQMLWPAGIYN